MDKVLVTGARGFVGRHTLVPLLAAGYDVHGVTSRAIPRGGFETSRGVRLRPDQEGSETAGTDDPRVTWHRANLLDLDAAEALVDRVRPDGLLHLAWVVEHGKYWTDRRNYQWLSASVALLQRFVERGGRQVVVAGTSTEYDWTALGNGVCHETRTPRHPRTPYGQTKDVLRRTLEGDEALSALRVGWGRLFQVYGPYEQPGRLVPSVIRALLRGEPARVSSGRQVRDFIDVRDAARALVVLLSSRVTGAVNVANGQPVAVATVLRMLGEITGRPELVQLGVLSDRPDDPQALVADVGLLTDAVQFRAMHPLDDGLRETVAWWQRRSEVEQIDTGAKG